MRENVAIVLSETAMDLAIFVLFLSQLQSVISKQD